MMKQTPKNQADRWEKILNRLPVNLQILLGELPHWLPQLKEIKENLLRSMVVAALALQMAGCQPTSGNETQSPSPTPIVEPYVPPTSTPTITLTASPAALTEPYQSSSSNPKLPTETSQSLPFKIASILNLSPEELSHLEIEEKNDIAVASIKKTIKSTQAPVTARSLNVREGLGTNFNIITSLPYDQIVTVLGEDNGWYQVQLSDGTVGWVSGQYVSLQENSTTVKDDIAVSYQNQWFTPDEFEQFLKENQLINTDEIIIEDPRSTNPELFNLTRSDAPIPQFVKAMRMAGIEVSGGFVQNLYDESKKISEGMIQEVIQLLPRKYHDERLQLNHWRYPR